MSPVSNASTSDPLSYPLRELTMQKLIETAETDKRLDSSESDQSLFFRIPKKLYDTNRDVYRPQQVSLGPVHHVSSGLDSPNNFDLLAMEGIKHAAMLRLLKDADYDDTLRSMKGYVAQNLDDICNCYYDNLRDNISQELVGRIVLVDACFLIDYFYRILRKASSGIRDKNDYSIFWSLRRDATLVENQLPLFVIWEFLEKIHSNLSEDQMCLYMLELVRLTPFPPSNIKDNVFYSPHLLELITKCHLSVDEEVRPQNSNDLPRWFQLQSATKLNAAGVRFQRAEGGNILALEFANGLLRIPALVIHDSTETLLVNLLAYERLKPNRRCYLASYVMLMRHLVETKKDLEFLQNQGIIVNELGSREDGSKIFHNISTQALLGPFYFQALWEDIEAYVNSRRTRYIVDLKRRYFQNPWTAISLFAAVVLLILTTLQTIYTIIPFYKKGH